MATRKGPMRIADIDPKILTKLNRGEMETATLVEALAVDFRILMSQLVGKLDSSADRRLAPAVPFTQRMLAAGQIVWERLGVEGFERCLGHRSDMVRSWACYALAAEPKGTLAQRLARVRPLADDPHFGVRECAWLALRPMVAKDVEKAVKLLKAWTKDESDRIRRFASEITRPRGVWCVHLTLLRDDPSLGVGVLEPLRSDESKYVQDSVANWLNDASKSRPEWVKEICGRWLTESPSPATQRICKRAMRSIKS